MVVEFFLDYSREFVRPLVCCLFRHCAVNNGARVFLFSYLRHLFEYIGTQFPPPSSLLYGKMGSITLFFFPNGNIKYDTTFYA